MVWIKVEEEGNQLEYWSPEANEELVGMLISKDANDFGGMNYKIIINSEQTVIVKGTTVLNNLFKHIEIGKKVKILYKGEKDTGKGNPLKLYELWQDQ